MRWNIEVDFRAITATLEMDVLRCNAVDSGQGYCDLFLSLQLGALGDGEGGIAHGRIATDAEL